MRPPRKYGVCFFSCEICTQQPPLSSASQRNGEARSRLAFERASQLSLAFHYRYIFAHNWRWSTFTMTK